MLCRTQQQQELQAHRAHGKAGSASVPSHNDGTGAGAALTIKQLAQQRIAEAEAAIAAAEQSAIQAMQGERYATGRPPPWATNGRAASNSAASAASSQQPNQRELRSFGSFAERLDRHDQHLSMRQHVQGAATGQQTITHEAQPDANRQHRLLPVVQTQQQEANATPPPWAHPSFLSSLPRYMSGASCFADASIAQQHSFHKSGLKL